MLGGRPACSTFTGILARYIAITMACMTSAVVSALVLVATLLEGPSAASPLKLTYPEVSANSNETKPLYFGLMQSFGGGFNSSGVVPGVDVALDQINSDDSILPGYTLHYELSDSQCERSTALDNFYQLIVTRRYRYIFWLGCGCSSATEPIAESTRYLNTTHLSCVSSSSALADRQRFSYYFQLLRRDDNLAHGFFSIIRKYGWEKVAIITQAEDVFTTTVEKLVDRLQEAKITWSNRQFRTGIAEIGQPFETGARVFVVSMYENHARDLLCEAYRQGIKYPTHILLTYGWYTEQWWLKEGNHSCTPEQRESAVSYTLGPIQFEFISDNATVADTGINGSTYTELYFRRIKESTKLLYENRFEDYSTGCYDATWTLAYALNKTITDLQNMEGLRIKAREEAGLDNSSTDFGLEDFKFSSNIITRTLFEHLEETNFTGITGRVNFDDDGIREGGLMHIRQVRPAGDSGSIKAVKIGKVAEGQMPVTFVYFDNWNDENVWPNGLIPYDGVAIEEVVTVDVALTVFYSLFATAGIIFTVACLTFNFIFRNRTLIKLTSPNLNYMIGVGAFLLYVDVLVLVVPTTNRDAVSVLCNMTPWLTSIGCALCFGTMLAKMARVYYIFNSPRPTKNALSDWKLALLVLALVVGDLVILVIYTAVEGARGNLEAERIENRENPTDIKGERDAIYDYYFYTCSSTSRDIVQGILYGCMGVLQGVALLFAFTIRKVNVKGLDESKTIAAAVYISSITLAVILVSTYSLVDYVNVYPVVIGLGLLIGATAITMLAFVPKMIGLYQDPQGEHIFSSRSGMSHPESESSSSAARKSSELVRKNTTVVLGGDNVEILKTKIAQLQDKLTKLEMAGDTDTVSRERPQNGRGTIRSPSKASMATQTPISGNGSTTVESETARNVPEDASTSRQE